ncbi:NOB1 family endonuclease [Methanolobus halotolerans]|uniref:DNA-binding protein n=1 Tax=Methanolobus halotolerans TaxID=2052935 RepID=A0A4E0Q338_9EURY|nr:DNA-binding protein [Methanolobus halotolerans]TGC07429.1 DNA-binding protein [Methanolobus halotolerans]
MVYFIADSAVFIMGKDIDPVSIITVSSVVGELRSSEASLRFELALEGGAKVEMPDPVVRRRVLEVAESTRDVEELSATDIDILSKALEYGNDAVLLSDDYAVQNVAQVLGIMVKPVVQKEIRDVLQWQKECTGCRRRFDTGDICQVCGSTLRKRRKRKI